MGVDSEVGQVNKTARLTIWQVRSRIALLHRFADLFCEYYNGIEFTGFHQAREKAAAVKARGEINPMLPSIRQAMEDAGLNAAFWRRDPPAVGGRSMTFQPLDNLFYLYEYDMDPNRYLDLVHQAIGLYKGESRKALLRTINPFFWLGEAIALVIGAPFRLLTSLGLLQSPDSRHISVLRGILVFIGTLATYAVAFLTVAEKLGYLSALKNWIRRLF